MTAQDGTFQTQLDALKQNNPLPAIAERYGVILRRSGRNFIGRCPFHDDRNPSFSIYLADSGDWAFFCHSASCGVSGDLFKFVGLMQHGPGYTGRGADFRAVLDQLSTGDFQYQSKLRAEDLTSKQPVRPEINNEIKEIWDAALGVAHQLLLREERILDYLYGRGFDEEVLSRWRFGWWPKPSGEISPVVGALFAAGYRVAQLLQARLLRCSSYDDSNYEFFAGRGQLSGRILCADLDHARRPAYLLARLLPWEDDGETAKYLGPPNFAKPVLGIASLRREDQPVALVEGFWNMITLRKWGVDAVAVSGANMSVQQVQMLIKLSRPLVPIRDIDQPNADGVIPGLAALRAWQQSIPGLPDGIELPQEVDGIAIKDVNDLDKHPDGVRIFKRLARKWQLKVGAAK
jgi:DNA primase